MELTPRTPIIVTGGETGCGEVLRGDILHIDYDEAKEVLSYAIEALDSADKANAPAAVIESLVEIITEAHGEPVDPKFMTREARIAELQGYDERSEQEQKELDFLVQFPRNTPADFHAFNRR